MKDKSKLIAIVLSIITIVVVVSNFLFKKESMKEEIIHKVTNYSNFYTVNSCLYRTINYISTKDSKSLWLLLRDSYKDNNKITEDNVLTLFPNVENDSTFVSEHMYYTVLSDNINKYYVKGYIQKNQIFDEDVANKLQKNYVYFIVYLDTENKIFSIEPYSGKLFIEGEKNG